VRGDCLRNDFFVLHRCRCPLEPVFLDHILFGDLVVLSSTLSLFVLEFYHAQPFFEFTKVAIIFPIHAIVRLPTYVRSYTKALQRFHLHFRYLLSVA